MSFEAEATFLSEHGLELKSSDGLKLLGFRFGHRPTCHEQVEAMRKSFRGRYWLLIHIKQQHYSKEELLKAYITLIRPIAEYCGVVLHSMLTDKQDEEVEQLQASALRYIFGYGVPYAKMREEAGGLETLTQRRIAACDKFAANCVRSGRFSHWFPPTNQTKRSRHTLAYREDYAICERLRNSPLFHMRRRLNGKLGKFYGQRNSCYRDTK